MNIKKISILAIALVVALFILRTCFAGPEGQIRKQLAAMEELVSYEAGEGDLATLGKVRRLGSLFTEDVKIRLSGFSGARNVNGRKEVQQAAMAARSQVKRLSATLHDITVLVAEDKRSASVEATGRAKIAGEESSVVQDFVFSFTKTDEGWLVDRVETVEALR